MKRHTTLVSLLLFLCATTLFAQVPEKFSYQAVVRNASNSLIANASVGFRVSILQGSSSSSAVYVETHTATTNANGLVTLSIGGGNVQQGTFADIEWASGPFFLKTETDPNGGSNYSISTTQQLLSVPYALYSKEAGNGFSGDYNDLVNVPQIPQIPADVSAFNNDAGYITSQDIPEIPIVPTNVSAFTNDMGYIVEETQALSDVTAIGNSAGNRQLKDVSDPTESYDAVNLRTLTLQMDSLQYNFQQQIQQMQQQMSQMQQQIDTLQIIVDSLDINNDTPGNTLVIDEKSCPDAQTVTDHEGNVYATVQIGNQCWMRDNLRTTTSPSTGTNFVISVGTVSSSYTGKQACWCDNNPATYAPMNFGLLYNWNAAVDTFNTIYGETSVNTNSNYAVSVTFTGHRRGVCPEGWHLPSDAEWTALTNYVSSQSEYTCGGNASYIAKALASTEVWNTFADNCTVGNNLDANNATGFSAIPTGLEVDVFYAVGKRAYFWSSTPLGSCSAYYLELDYDYPDPYRNNYTQAHAFSVRCLRD